MSDAVNYAEKNLRHGQLFIRIASYVFIIVGLLFFAMAMLLYTAFGDAEVIAAAGLTDDALDLARILFIVAAAFGVFSIILGILGLRCAHNSRKVMPFCVLSVVLAVVVAAGEVTTNYSGITQALTGGGLDLLYLVFVVCAIGSAIASFALINYNRRHPEGELVTPDPEYVPDSMKQTGAAAPFSPTGQGANKGAGPLELRIDSKIGSIIHDKMDVLDAHDNVIYQVHSKAVSMSDRTFIDDAAGNQVASIHCKVVSIHSIYYVEMSNGTSFELSRELLHLKDFIDIEALGWQLRGDNILEFNFEIVDASENVIAQAHRAVVSLHDTYTLTVFDRSKTDEVVAVFVIMKHMMEHRASEQSEEVEHTSSN